MAIFLTRESRIIVQGITGAEGMKHAAKMLAAGSRVVGGVNPRKAGQSVVFDGVSVPVFGTVSAAMSATGADVSVVFVPPGWSFGFFRPSAFSRRGKAAGLVARPSQASRPGCSCRQARPSAFFVLRLFRVGGLLIRVGS